jgi:hypothetical protein
MSRWGQEEEHSEYEPIPIWEEQRVLPIQPKYFEADLIPSNSVSAELNGMGCKSPRNHHVNGDGQVVCDADPNKRLCFFYRRAENRSGSNSECPIGLPDRVFDEVARNVNST